MKKIILLTITLILISSFIDCLLENPKDRSYGNCDTGVSLQTALTIYLKSQNQNIP
jgi:hypothetical protein